MLALPNEIHEADHKDNEIEDQTTKMNKMAPAP